ncbi:unnamed protein product [Rotaria sp. Silwood2]|nr:unnamed protein product [Rotaria sp. Silwood2]CAF3226067.1 unnamed protein product [Rotaria sp. Silwood2]CAF3257244.1 unnamed protein product [Rotaria sp. Silwood2]CAF3417403.1 unnamed protein product [Rotaria sp. Silwood2]CAF4496482.1 unnamed protein product [Rotaria sp. Silwood2]
MSLTASFILIDELLSCFLLSNNEEDLVKLVYNRMNNFVDGENNDECACAIFNILSKNRSYLYKSSNAESYYLTENALFEYFTSDAFLYPSSDLFVYLFVNVLSDIHSNDEDEEEISLDRRS